MVKRGIFFLTLKFSTKAKLFHQARAPPVTVSCLHPSILCLMSLIPQHVMASQPDLTIPHAKTIGFLMNSEKISQALKRTEEEKIQSLLSKTELIFCFLLHRKPPIEPGVWRRVTVHREPICQLSDCLVLQPGPKSPDSGQAPGTEHPHLIFPFSSWEQAKESLWHFRHGVLREGSFSCQRSQTFPPHL